MKNFTFTSLTSIFLAFSFILFLSNPAKACVDPEPTVTVHCDYDSNFTDIAVRVRNISLFTGSSVQFCSCAITNFTDIFSNILYVSFVDSGTNNPIGFEPWSASANATNAWESVLATGNWDGFLAQVASGGALPGVPVELLIRAQLPLGYTFALLDSNLVISQLGTDEWDNTNQTLANSHQEIVGFWSGAAATYTEISPSSTFFEDLDNQITTGIDDLKTPLPSVTLFPNPAKDQISIRLEDAIHRYQKISLIDFQGRELRSLFPPDFLSSEIDLNVKLLPTGLYFIRVKSDLGIITKKLIIE